MEVDVTPSLEILPREVIEAEIEGIKARTAEFDERQKKMMEGLQEEDYPMLEDIGSRFEQGRFTDADFEAQYPGNEKAAQIYGLVKDAMPLMKRMLELEEELKPYWVKDARDLLDDFSARINYRALIDKAAQAADYKNITPYNDEFYQLWYMARYRKEVDDDNFDGREAHYARFVRDNLDKWKSEWKEKDLLLEKPVDLDTATEVPSHEELLIAFNELHDETERFNELTYTYRLNIKSRYPFDHSLWTIRSVIMKSDGEMDNLTLDPRFLLAAKQFLEDRRRYWASRGACEQTEEELGEYLDPVRELEIQKTIEEVRLAGFVAPEGKRLVIDEEEVKRMLAYYVPPYFLKNLLSISAIPGYREKDPKDPTIETVGRFKPNYDEDGKIISGSIEVYREPCVDESADEHQANLALLAFEDTLLHEIGHKVHMDLTLEEMEAFESVVAEDPVDVSWYVKYSRAESKQRVKREDFTDSFKLYHTNPALLVVISQRRYLYMHDLFLRYLRDDQQPMFAAHQVLAIQTMTEVWKKKGWNKEDILKAFGVPTD